MADRPWLVIALAVIAIVGFVRCVDRDASRCSAAGGFYLYREYKCVTGIKELKP